ncbi:MAG: glycoside hydrolase [Oscillospiraceae bacterium]|nr:glycoside hydrolase [Oscillospiraceae bacterium]
MEFRVAFLGGEYFWGGAVACGTDMPINAHSSYCRDYRKTAAGNQMMPLFLSSKGRYIWSENAFKVWVENGELCFEGTDFELYEEGETLRGAYLAAMNRYFPFKETRKQGKTMPREFFSSVQYNTWMEYTYDPTQQKVLDYAHAIIDNGFEPGILIIDEGWHTRYGLWQFDLHKFPDPKAMVDELHRMGFKVLLWVTPLVTCDGPNFVKSCRSDIVSDEEHGLYLRTESGEVAVIGWWNGFSAVLDMRKESDRRSLDRKLQFLMSEYGVDGFKFDGGSYDMYQPENIRNGKAAPDHDPAALNIAWNEFGARYRFHEYKDTFKGGGKATIQRLRDRNPTWEGEGINTIIPCSILQGLSGHPFICPDMIGGGEWSYNFLPGFKLDEELFIRMAQVSALFPMMQFSWAPWRILSKESVEIVLNAVAQRKSFTDKIIDLVRNSEETGEPIIRAMEYNCPGQGYAEITDQFMLGEDILVCPSVTKGCFERDVVLPCGSWKDDDGTVYEGGQTLRLKSPIEKLLYFTKK